MKLFNERVRSCASCTVCAVLAVIVAANRSGLAHAAVEPSGQNGATEFEPLAVTSTGSVAVGGAHIEYRAVAGTLVVHAKGRDNAEASIFYVAYFKCDAKAADRPITFLFNGGPGSSSVWLDMGAFGPVRVVTDDHSHTPPAPYQTVANGESLLDASDLAFIDAPGTGYSRIRGKDAKKAFYGVDPDIHAFSVFIREFLSKYGRWNSPKYVFGESYGTLRAVGLALALERDDDIDLNGVILLSCILNGDLMPDDPELNPGIDEPYIVALPTYAATAWYHHALAERPKDLRSFLHDVEHFATTEYALALLRGNSLDPASRQAIAKKLHAFTGLPVAYLLKSNLRIQYGAFQQELLADQDLTTGTLDSRFTGPTLDPLSETAGYDPQDAAIAAAYIAAWHGYAWKELHYGNDETYRVNSDIGKFWDFRHRLPGEEKPMNSKLNMLPDLTVAMKRNPMLKVMVNGGYFDVATPYYEGWFEMHHMAIPPALQKNIEYRYYQSGHMVYVHLPALIQLHHNVAEFIRRTDNLQ
jgi:carboxypeptidase C (cathepsin A)